MKGPIIGLAIGIAFLIGAYALSRIASIYNGTLAIDMALWVIGAGLCGVSVIVAFIDWIFR